MIKLRFALRGSSWWKRYKVNKLPDTTEAAHRLPSLRRPLRISPVLELTYIMNRSAND